MRERDPFTREGMDEGEHHGGKLMIGKTQPAGDGLRCGRNVPRIAQQRAADMRHVHAKLMRAPGDGRKQHAGDGLSI